MLGNLEPEESVMSRGGWLGKLSIAIQELQESGAWDIDDELKVCIAGTLPKDKFIVIQNTTKRTQK
jgi:hypothetical protein